MHDDRDDQAEGKTRTIVWPIGWLLLPLLRLLRSLLPKLWLVLLVPALANATDRYVDCGAGVNGSGTSGSPYNVLSSAIAVAAAGDTVYFKGTCSIGHTYDNAWGDSGTAGNPIIYRAWPGFERVAQITGSISQYNDPRREYVEFRDFKIVGGIWWEGDGADKSEGIVFSGLEISGGTNETTDEHDTSNWSGIWLVHTNGAVLSHNYVHDVYKMMSGTQGDGYSGNCFGLGSAVLGTGICGAGFKFYYAYNTIVEYNLLEENTIEGINDKDGGNGNIFRYNRFINNGQKQLYINNQDHNVSTQIYENIFDCSALSPLSTGTWDAVYVKFWATDGQLYSNTMYECGMISYDYDGLQPSSVSSGWEIHDNIVWYATAPTSSKSTISWNITDNQLPDLLDYNLYWKSRIMENRGCNTGSETGCGGQTLDQRTLTSSGDLTTWSAVHGYDTHSVYGEADFVDAAGGDFHLDTGSPGLNVGTAAIDMGAYPDNDDTQLIGPDWLFDGDAEPEPSPSPSPSPSASPTPTPTPTPAPAFMPYLQ